MDKHVSYMTHALKHAILAGERDEVPIGAIIVERDTGRIVSSAGNMTRAQNDPCAHAEVEAIRLACQDFGAQRIPQCDIYVTLEPCTMCAGAISFARINTVYIGAPDPKGGAVLSGVKFFEQPTCHHRPAVQSGILEQECGEILRDFFRKKRKEK